MDLLRASVRPMVTYALVSAYIWGVFHPGTDVDGLYGLNLITLAFWFGERALKKLGLDLSGLGRKGTA